MFSVSRRDKATLEQLYPLLKREVTADPEQHNPARRAAIRAAIAQAEESCRQRHAADLKKKDDELRAKLDGEFSMTFAVQTSNCDSNEAW